MNLDISSENEIVADKNHIAYEELQRFAPHDTHLGFIREDVLDQGDIEFINHAAKVLEKKPEDVSNEELFKIEKEIENYQKQMSEYLSERPDTFQKIQGFIRHEITQSCDIETAKIIAQMNLAACILNKIISLHLKHNKTLA